MTILFFTRLYYPHIGGVETHVSKISQELLNHGHSITIVTEQYDTALSEIDEHEGITIYRIPVGSDEKRKKYNIWKWLFTHSTLIKNSDIIHCHDVFFWYLPFRFLYPHKPIYTTFHGYETVFPPTTNAIRMRKLSENLSKGTICVGDYIAKWYGIKPSFVTYGGAEVSHNVNITKVKKNKILFVGRVEQDNGVGIYVKALNFLKNKNVSFNFTVAGDGTMRNQAEKHGKVIGFTDTHKVIADNTIIFASSYLSILEALVQKKIVISTYTNPLKEDYLRLSPFTKFILIARDASEVEDIITLALQTPWKYTSMVQNGQAWARQQTWEKVADVYTKLWNI